MASQPVAELRPATFTFLLLASLHALGLTQTRAQSDRDDPRSLYGGRLVPEMVPYQSISSEFAATPNGPPIYLSPWSSQAAPLQPIPTTAPASQWVGQPGRSATTRLPPGHRQGVFQKLFFTGTYLPQFSDDSLGSTDLEAGIVFGFPLFRVNTPLLVTPRFGVRYLDRPAAPDLPKRVYDAEVSFRHLRKFGDGPWAMNAAVTLGHYSDFESSDADALRVTGQAFAVYESSPATTWVFGVVYLNREDVSIVPAVGLIYEPTPDVKYEAILPRPRIAWRLPGGPATAAGQRWAYVAGKFGGGVWSIERPVTGSHDLLSSSDFRLLVGVERKIVGGLSRRFEAGYVFGRELQFSSATPDVRLDDSLFVRAGLTY